MFLSLSHREAGRQLGLAHGEACLHGGRLLLLLIVVRLAAQVVANRKLLLLLLQEGVRHGLG